MRLSTTAALGSLLAVTLAGPALAAAGDLDTTFGGDGKVTTGFAGHAFVGGAAIQADGKIVAAGDVRTPSGEFMFALARYRPNGRLDDTFGGDGKVTTGFAGQAFAESVAIQDDGKILAAGRFNPDPGNGRFALVGYQPSGALDDTFGGNGKVTTGFAGSESAEAVDIAIQTDGKIVAGGDVLRPSGEFHFGLARYKPSGGLDDTFGGDGKVTTEFAESDSARAHGVAIQADGNIVAAGGGESETPSLDLRFALARYRPGGPLDDTFRGDGRVTPGFTGRAVARGVAIQADGKNL